MRLWSLHPKYLDTKGLLGLWREALLAQRVLQGATRGYRNHPQLQRFRQQENQQAAISNYLKAVADEGRRRGYRFDVTKIGVSAATVSIPVTTGQIRYEWQHLKSKLQVRDPERYLAALQIESPEPNPVFVLEEGPVESWEVRRNS